MKSLSTPTVMVTVSLTLLILFSFPRTAASQTRNTTMSMTKMFCTGKLPCVPTYHNSNNRDGVNPRETVLSPATNFSNLKVKTVATDGLIFAQPLYIHGLKSTNGKVGECTGAVGTVFVATENNSIYAINAANGKKCWHTVLDPNESAIPSSAIIGADNKPCTEIVPQEGISGTPVIDTSVSPPILYVLTRHQVTTPGVTYRQLLHAIDTTTGQEVVTATDIGALLGDDFSALAQRQRPGLALYNPSAGLANLYVAWGSQCDSNVSGHYNGWVAEFQIDYFEPGQRIRFAGNVYGRTQKRPAISLAGFGCRAARLAWMETAMPTFQLATAPSSHRAKRP